MQKIFFIIIFFSSIIFPFQSDSTSDNNEWKWGVSNLFSLNVKRSPTITINYGFSKINLKFFDSPFEDPNLAEIKIGYTTEMPLLKNSNIIKYEYNSIFLSNFSSSLGKTPSSEKIKSNMWRFGINRSLGFGYSFGKSAFIPYASSSFTWTQTDFKDQPLNQTEKNRLALFDESFRFGTSAEGGFRIKIIKQINLDLNYERAIIFQRHLFWKWAGSSVLELIANFSLDSFINEILEVAPSIVPVVNFILKNALNYGIYELRQKEMNWPFESESPLSYDQFKFGLTFVFED